MDPYNPTIEDANEARSQADEIERTAASIQNQGNSDTAYDLNAEAAELRRSADKEENEAIAQADQEKAYIDEKYGTG